MNKYSEVYSKLIYETATVIFLKKDGDVRIMLATRNLHTAELNYGFLGKELGGYDNRCNINNGNLSSIDLILGEPRIFNIDRLIGIEYHGIIDTKEKFDALVKSYSEFKSNYESNNKMSLNMDMLN